jgi:TnsA endonuclease N terminal/TnsA endonuclease C terminal
MAVGRIKWTERKISEMAKCGCGRGTGSDYLPWLEVTSVSSLGRSRRVWSPKTGRTHHLLSDVEYGLFLVLEWASDVTDIREQFPLDRDITQDVARLRGVRHPFYPGTNVPTVMTVDFMVTRVRDGLLVQEAFNAKRSEEAEDERSLHKLEIQRRTLALLDVPHHLVFHDELPRQKVKNIEWIRDSLVKEGEVEPQPGYWASMAARMAAELTNPAKPSSTLVTYCASFDARHGAEPGAGLRAARMLMQERALSVDLGHPEIQALPLAHFKLTAQPGKLRAIGGA